jgi:8-oxo-dGTP pyrophosphatase MutT (NUDIX family)
LRIGVLALIDREGRVLLERRADDGTWGLMGGALEAGESVGEALVREVREETALTATSVELFGVLSDRFATRRIRRRERLPRTGHGLPRRGLGRAQPHECGVARAAVRVS